MAAFGAGVPEERMAPDPDLPVATGAPGDLAPRNKEETLFKVIDRVGTNNGVVFAACRYCTWESRSAGPQKIRLHILGRQAGSVRPRACTSASQAAKRWCEAKEAVNINAAKHVARRSGEGDLP